MLRVYRIAFLLGRKYIRRVRKLADIMAAISNHQQVSTFPKKKTGRYCSCCYLFQLFLHFIQGKCLPLKRKKIKKGKINSSSCSFSKNYSCYCNNLIPNITKIVFLITCKLYHLFLPTQLSNYYQKKFLLLITHF